MGTQLRGHAIMLEMFTVVITMAISSLVTTGQIQLVDGGLTAKTNQHPNVSFHNIFVSGKNHCTIMPPFNKKRMILVVVVFYFTV